MQEAAPLQPHPLGSLGPRWLRDEYALPRGLAQPQGAAQSCLGEALFHDLRYDDDGNAVAGFPLNEPQADGCRVLVTGKNFGCGSSREHAPWALEVNGIHLVVAESFARIFRQNMFNCGMLAVELPAATIDRLFQGYAHRETTATTNLKQQVIKIAAGDQTEEIQFSVPEFARALVETGGWVEYADSHY